MTLIAGPTAPAKALVEAFDLSPAQIRDFQAYQGILADWNGRMNLVGPSVTRDFWVRHALDSAQLFHVERQALRWADVGSGAGFPGVPLAILMKGRPGSEIHLIESIGKRAGFLRHVCETLGLQAEVHHGRAEDLSPSPKVEVVTARACAPLDRLLDYTLGFFRQGARGLFLKGQGVEAELAHAKARWRFEAELLASLSDSSGRILRIAKVGRRGAG